MRSPPTIETTVESTQDRDRDPYRRIDAQGASVIAGASAGRSAALRIAIVGLAWISYLVVGLWISGDYGTHGDEANSEAFGARWGEFIESAVVDHALPTVEDPSGGTHFNHDLTHGPFWELVLYGARKAILPAKADSRDVLILRHRLNFMLFFAASLAIYGAGQRVFRDWRLSFAAWGIFILQPQIFAHVFFNTVDIAFLSLYTIGIFSLLEFQSRRSVASALIHAGICAALVDTRVAGLLVPALTVIVGLDAAIKSARSKSNWADLAALYGIFVGAAALLIISFNPFLWQHTASNFMGMLRGGAFAVENVSAAYNPVLMFATTPFVYSACFFAGLWAILSRRIGRRDMAEGSEDASIILLFLFLVPIALPIFFGTTLFGGWRHHFFVYAPFALIAAMGIRWGFEAAAALRTERQRTFVRCAVGTVVSSGWIAAILFLITNHPFQFAYSNGLLGAHSQVLNLSFTSDIWGVSFRQQLEYLARHDPSLRIAVYFSPSGGRYNLNLLPPADRHRFHFVDAPDKADYLLVKSSQLKSSALLGRIAHVTYVDGTALTAIVRTTSAGQGAR